MGGMSNLQAVAAIYAAFARGDAAAMAERFAPDIDWEYAGDPQVPWLVPGRGPAAFGRFLEGLAGLDFQRFDVKALLQGDGVVLALIDLDATVKATGRTIHEVDEVHVWRFDPEGQVIAFRHRVDTRRHRTAAGLD